MAPPTAAPDAKFVGEGSSSDVIARAPPVTIIIHTAPIRTKKRMFCISIFVLDADYSGAAGARCVFLLEYNDLIIANCLLGRGVQILCIICTDGFCG